MILPTALSMKAKFPEFSAIPDATIEFAIEEASRNVDDSWLEKDQTLACMYLAAHYIAVAKMRAESMTGQVVASERVAELGVTYANPQMPTGKMESDLYMTQYGIRFMELAHINFPAIAVI